MKLKRVRSAIRLLWKTLRQGPIPKRNHDRAMLWLSESLEVRAMACSLANPRSSRIRILFMGFSFGLLNGPLLLGAMTEGVIRTGLTELLIYWWVVVPLIYAHVIFEMRLREAGRGAFYVPSQFSVMMANTEQDVIEKLSDPNFARMHVGDFLMRMEEIAMDKIRMTLGDVEFGFALDARIGEIGEPSFTEGIATLTNTRERALEAMRINRAMLLANRKTAAIS